MFTARFGKGQVRGRFGQQEFWISSACGFNVEGVTNQPAEADGSTSMWHLAPIMSGFAASWGGHPDQVVSGGADVAERAVAACIG